LQNRLVAAAPQLGQLVAIVVPHDPQNFASAGFSAPHDEQRDNGWVMG
jgi:hypothetical protein